MHSYPGLSPHKLLPDGCRTAMKSPSEKHFRCTVCQRGFTRIDHLKRHQLRHSGLKPYSCIFCNESFARCDNLRDHYADCAKRGDRKIPETGQRGRRRHACQYCTSMKLRCDGMSPCDSCKKRNIECNNERRPLLQGHEFGSNVFSPSENQSTRADSEPAQHSSDRGSIKFLLNGGTDSFTEHFHLPPHTDRARGLEYHNQKGFEEAERSILGYPVKEGEPAYAPTFVESDPTSLSFFQDNFISFFNGPFGDLNKPLEDPYSTEIAYQSATPPEKDSNSMLPGDQPVHNSERPFAIAMIQAILARAWTVPLDPKSQEEISINLHFLLTTARIRKFVALYSKFWQTHCPIIHIASFDPETVSLPLLASVVFMGSIYSDDLRESGVAKKVLDFTELFVFSSDIFAPESEIGANFRSGHGVNELSDSVHLQNLQAGYIMMTAQYWAGSRASRNRAMENRFSEVVKVARRIGLPKCRHLPQERIHEPSWIEKEACIRTMTIISLMDSAFSFFQNYPCRLAHIEMDCDLPCEESVFGSIHPFAEPNFRLSRELTVSEAFQNLFDERPEDPPHSLHESSKQEGNPMGLTVYDMFLLIHLLYSFINTHMTLLVPVLSRAQMKNPTKFSGSSDNNSPIIPGDTVLLASRTALSRWRDYWLALHSQVPGDQWASMGFYKNGYNFWLVSQLLITKKESVDVVMQMEVNCEDKLEKLKVLLMDE